MNRAAARPDNAPEMPLQFWWARVKFAYADPPYLGCGALYKAHHPDALDWDSLDTHRALIERLCDEYVDGWVMSLSSPSLRHLLPLCPSDVRVGAWVKPFASFKPGVTTAYAWEPAIFRGGRKRPRTEPTVRDWVAESITLKRGLTGAKPAGFMNWALDLLNVEPGDTVDDLFPGTGACSSVIAQRLRLHNEPTEGLFA